ncbi:MAG: LacI family DNA-binding transcriptional regulator [Chthoniobacteraceae bacterium]
MNPTSTDGHDGQSREDLQENRFPTTLSHPYNKTITMATIAKAAGVSQGAISSLLNDRDYGIRVSEKTRKRVFKACRELGYVPNDLRAVVRMYPELGDSCLLVSGSLRDWATNPFYARILKGIIDTISPAARHITLAEYEETTDYLEHAELLPHPIRSGTASKFICIGAMNFSLVQALIKRDFPVAFLGSDVSIPGVTTIQPDYAEASRLAIDYLLKAGHRQIAILSGPFGSEDHAIAELNRGIRLCYERSGISFDTQNIIHGDLTFKSGAAAIDVLFSRNEKPTAIFSLSDEAASGALSQIQKLKPSHPLSIIGCGDASIADALSLTTIHLPAEEMGAEALRDIEARVQKGALLESKKVVLPVRLVERKSTSQHAIL